MGGRLSAFAQDRRGAALVAFLLLLQWALLWLSTDAYVQISIFCTGPATSRLSLPFGLLHLLFLALLLLGAVSLAVRRLRLPYIALLCAVLVVLPVQATLVSHGALTCDGF